MLAPASPVMKLRCGTQWDFITFGDFKDQTEYGKAGSEINKRVLSQVLDTLDRDNLMGKTISFMGAFSIRTFNLLPD